MSQCWRACICGAQHVVALPAFEVENAISTDCAVRSRPDTIFVPVLVICGRPDTIFVPILVGVARDEKSTAPLSAGHLLFRVSIQQAQSV